MQCHRRVKLHLIFVVDCTRSVWPDRQFWGSRLFESSRRSTQDKVKSVKTKKAIPAIAAAIRGALTVALPPVDKRPIDEAGPHDDECAEHE